MTTSDGPLLGLLVLGSLLVLIGGGLTGLAWFALRYERRWPNLLLCALCGVGLFVAGAQGKQGVSDLAWVATAFAVPLALSAMAFAFPSRPARLMALAAAPLPAIVFAWYVLTDMF